jgi:hypothetical protein
MPKRLFPVMCASALFFVVATVASAVSTETHTDEAQFLTDNSAAMHRMMSAMEIEPSGDIDADFVAMMVPHHQGAIDMAVAQLRYGHNEQLKRLAQEIIVTQKAEIAAMELAVKKPAPSPVSSIVEPTAVGVAISTPSRQQHVHGGN